ncbi:MAG: DciA family protein [Usitatibacter sp.]
MASESIAKLLVDNAELRPLAERLEHIKRLQKRYRTLAPESLAEASRVCAIDGTTVVICASSGPVAAALRHLAPRLLEGLRGSPRKSSKHSRDQELTSIRIEVQVDRPAPRRPVKPRGEMPHDKLSRLAGTLEDSPLKETLERIARDQSSRTRSKT